MTSSLNGLRRTASSSDLTGGDTTTPNVATRTDLQSSRQRNSGPLSSLPQRPGQEAGLRLADLPPRANIPTTLQQPGGNPAWMSQPAGLPAATGPNPHTAPHAAGLLQHDPDPQAVQNAHQDLQAAGYQFAGYHGTNHTAFTSMLNDGLDPSRIGSNSGVAKGSGFYVSHQPKYAEEWANGSTQDEPLPPKFEERLRPGDDGVERVARVYVKDIETMKPGQDVAWGMHPSAGDPNDDKKVQKSDTTDVHAKANDLEMVFSPHTYQNLAVIPSLGREQDKAQLTGDRAKWPAHQDPGPKVS
jgi:hypothetical protein